MAGGVVTAGAGFAICKGALGYVSVSKEEYNSMKDTYERFGKVEQLYDTINESYYRDVDEQDVVDGACKGLVAGLGDPYSSYMTRKNTKTGSLRRQANIPASV